MTESPRVLGSTSAPDVWDAAEALADAAAIHRKVAGVSSPDRRWLRRMQCAGVGGICATMALPGAFPALASLAIILVLILMRRTARLDERVVINGLQSRTPSSARIVVFGLCLVAFVVSYFAAMAWHSTWIPVGCGLAIAVILHRMGRLADSSATRRAGNHNG